MSAVASVRIVDPRPLVGRILAAGGTCSFDDALVLLRDDGLTESEARDALWRLLSQGVLEFTPERQITVPKNPALEKVAG